jgi:toxin ParE1/3/4
MSWDIRFRPEAKDEIQEIYDRYELQRAGLGESFLEGLDKAIELICANPKLFREVQSQIRSGRVPRFPYAIYYSLELHQVNVLSVLHNRRNLGWIEDRLEP